MSDYEKQVAKYESKKTLKRMMSILCTLLIIAGIGLVFMNPIIEKVLVPYTVIHANKPVKGTTSETIAKNKERIASLTKSSYKKTADATEITSSENNQSAADANQETNISEDEFSQNDPSQYDSNISYNANNVTAIDRVPFGQTVNIDYMVGKLYIPSVGLNMAVLEGISNENLNVASGTMKPGQEMGKRNYAIAGHNMLTSGALFTPILDVNEYDTVYLSDKQTVYEYVVTKKYVVNRTQGHVIEDSEAQEGQSIITLVTCYKYPFNERMIVRGELVKKYDISKATDDVKNSILN